MKISILSMQRVDNMGSLLQAYALYSLVRKGKNEAHFIDIKVEDNNEIISDARYSHKEESDSGKKIDKYFIIRALNKIREKRQSQIYEMFRNDFLNMGSYHSEEMDDVCIIGSDEVFNCLSPSPWGLSSQLFGNVNNTRKVITYAACCGATKYEDLPERARDIICQSFKRITAFSVRDDNTAHFIESFGYNNIEKHLDPVLIYDFSKEAERFRNVEKRLPSNYCILYSYHNRIHKTEEINSIKKFARKNGLKLITVGQPQYWVASHYVLHPFELITAFKNAKYVITDTFHGCILAAKYSSDYAVMTRPSNKNKLMDLVNTLGINQHVVDSMTQLRKHELGTKKEIEKVIESERKRSLEYLERKI